MVFSHYLAIHLLKILGLFPVLGYFEESCYEHLYTRFCKNIGFHSSGIFMLSSGIADLYGSYVFSFPRKCQTVYQSDIPFYIPTSNG